MMDTSDSDTPETGILGDFSAAVDVLNLFHIVPAKAADALYMADQCGQEHYLDAGITAVKAVGGVAPSALLGPLAVPFNVAASLTDADEVLKETGLPGSVVRTLSR